MLLPIRRLSGAGLLIAALYACGPAEQTIETEGPRECPEVIDRGGGIPDPPDGAALCPQDGVCNYQSQEGCADGEACRPTIDLAAGTVGPGCGPAGSKVAGESCEALVECARGHYCLDGVCRKLCCGGDWSACDPGESCIRQLFVDVADRRVSANVDFCFPVNNCDVLDRSGSCEDEPGRICRIVDPTGNVACAPESDLELGDPCDSENQCGPALSCAGGTCRRLCCAEKCCEPDCPAGTGCVHLDRLPDRVGECTPGF